jgi:hypothetical protein
MGGKGALAWFTAWARKRAVRAREERVPQGASIQDVATGGFQTACCVLRKKIPIGALGALWGQKLQDNSLSCDYLVWQAALINQRSQLF